MKEGISDTQDVHGLASAGLHGCAQLSLICFCVGMMRIMVELQESVSQSFTRLETAAFPRLMLDRPRSL